MKYICICYLLCLTLCSYCQENQNDYFFNELNISLNRTSVSDDNTENKFGFGVGAMRIIMKDRWINPLFGFEFNFTNQFKKRLYEGHFANLENVKYNINSFSIPILFRIHLNQQKRCFLEIGTFAELVTKSTKKGKMISYLPDENNNINRTEKLINENGGILPLNYGLSLGLGFKFPLRKHSCFIKSDYKYGLRVNNVKSEYFYNRYFRFVIGLDF